jgi:hypothetical protein
MAPRSLSCHSNSERKMSSPTKKSAKISQSKSRLNDVVKSAGSGLAAPKKRSFAPDRHGESSAGATGKAKKRSVAADRNTSSR